MRRRLAREVPAAACAIACFVCLWVPVSATGQNYPLLGLQVDQDVFFPPAEDKDYTMGVQFDLPRSARGQTPLRWFDWVAGRYGHQRLDESTSSSSHLGFSAFTPRKGPVGRVLAATQPILDDRPYASLLFAKARRASWTGRNAFTTELTIGLLGTRVGEKVQAWIHENISNDVRPGGWPNQISDGLSLHSLTGAYRVQYQRLVLGIDSADYDLEGPPGDLSVSVEGMAGFYTMARVGVAARLGWTKSPWPSVGSFFSGPAPQVSNFLPLRDAAEAASQPQSCSCSFIPAELYLWVGLGGQLWARNSLLQGQGDPDDPVNLSFSSTSPAPMRRWVKDVSLGASVRWSHVGIDWTLVAQHSPLFGGPHSRDHEWGTIRVSFLSPP
jgi:hypothetical protein